MSLFEDRLRSSVDTTPAGGKFTAGIAAMESLADSLGLSGVDHLRAAMTLTVLALQSGKAGDMMAALTLTTGAAQNLTLSGSETIRGMAHCSATDSYLQNVRTELEVAVSLALRGSFVEMKVSLLKAVSDAENAQRAYNREILDGGLVLPKFKRN